MLLSSAAAASIGGNSDAHLQSRFKLETDDENNDAHADDHSKKANLHKHSVGFKQFQGALGKLAKADNLDLVESYPKTFSEFCEQVYKCFDGIHSNQ